MLTRRSIAFVEAAVLWLSYIAVIGTTTAWVIGAFVCLSRPRRSVPYFLTGLGVFVLFASLRWALLKLLGCSDNDRLLRPFNCVNCGYDLGGIDRRASCPECGWGKPPGSVSAEP
jgi:hypothetical protein